MTVYLSGKITGDKHFKKKFLKAKVKLVKDGYDVINPCDINCYADLFKLRAVSAYRLCKDSNGARLELNYAKRKGKEILYEEN